MSRHLNIDPWFVRMPNNRLKMKRVSASAEKQFPRIYRLLYQESGASSICTILMMKQGCSLASAWAQVKKMFNEKPL
jgi:hypothetical protein